MYDHEKYLPVVRFHSIRFGVILRKFVHIRSVMTNKNLLPQDGEAYYSDKILDLPVAKKYFNELIQNIQWQHDKIIMFGKTIITKREVAWYGDAGLQYTYSGKTKKATAWTNTLLTLKNIVEEKTSETFNSCLLNLYHNGSEGMGWHADNEKDLKKDAAIASLSLGAERKFSFKHKRSKQTISILLENGSLLLMKGHIQQHWLHQRPASKKISEPRINLTFRQIIQ